MKSATNFFKKFYRKKTLKRVVMLFGVSLLLGLATFGILTFFNKPKNAEAAWMDYSWSYRTALIVVNSGAADSNKKIQFDIDTSTLITAGKIQADCGDSRFTDANGAPLQYFIDTAGGACNTNSTDYYVLTPTIYAGNTLIYHYYGNPAAANGTQAAQFSQATFTPTSTSSNTEEAGAAPVAWWKFDDGNGTTAKDSTLNANNGTLGGTTIPVWKSSDECISGKCLFFDGTTSKVTGSVIIKNVQSVSFWIKPNTIATQGLVNLDGGTHKINTNSSGVISAAGFTSPVYYLNGTAVTTLTLVQNQWNYVTITTATAFDSTSSFTFGTDGTNFIKGNIDEPKIYNYARTAAQTQTGYIQGAANIGSSASFGTNRNATGANLTNGLVGWWKMDESSWTNNCSTASVLDSSGNGNNGQACPNATGPTGGAAGKFGNGGSFDGTNYINFSDYDIQDIRTNDYTFSAWVKASSNPASAYIARKSDGSNVNGFLVLAQSGVIAAKLNGTSLVVTSSTTLTTGTWYFVTVTMKRSAKMALYINSNLESSTNISSIAGTDLNATAGLTISAASGNGSWNGSLDDVRIYNRALSPTEVQALYNYAPGPVAYYNLDENTGTTANDTSGNGRTGTLNGNAIWSPAKYGSGVTLDGSGDYIQVSDF